MAPDPPGGTHIPGQILTTRPTNSTTRQRTSILHSTIHSPATTEHASPQCKDSKIATSALSNPSTSDDSASKFAPRKAAVIARQKISEYDESEIGAGGSASSKGQESDNTTRTTRKHPRSTDSGGSPDKKKSRTATKKSPANNEFGGDSQTLEPLDLSIVDKSSSSVRPQGDDRLYGFPKHSNSGLSFVGANKNQIVMHSALDSSKPPLSDINEIFTSIVRKAMEKGFHEICEVFQEQKLRIVTMCSGTESPILAMGLIRDALKRAGKPKLEFEHVASAENEAFKQAYIQRNFAPPVIFRDVTEFDEFPDRNPMTVYGGREERPTGIHMLIAGSSCVDYSNLNNKPKKFEEEGQSLNTMRGVRAYADQCRPDIVILENVKTAPWDKIQEFWQAIGYYTQVVKIDSKNYYIPQTRQRGYMVAFNKRRAENTGLHLKEAAAKWVKSMQHLQQRASAPFTDFIFTDDDFYLDQLKCGSLNIRGADSAYRDMDWVACRERYAYHRVDLQLGDGRPQTNWKTNGSCKFPDFGWQKWARSQRERVWDTLDINHLAFVSERDYDMNYKHRWLELSQNVDRDQDSRRWGIIGCLTPSGLPYLSSRGGPVTGREALALQGLPLVGLSLSRETSKQLQDLAGNAMTTTVVAAAIISALIAVSGSSFLGTYPTKTSEDKTSRCNQPFEIEALLESQSNTLPLIEGNVSLGPDPDSSMKEVLEMASRTFQLCKCEGFFKMKRREFKRCSKCEHSACNSCAGNPEHDYQAIPSTELKNRVEPRNFMTVITDALPMALILEGLVFPNTLHHHHDLKDEGEREDYRKCREELSSKPTSFRFHSIKHGEKWRVLYDGEDARLELVFSRKQKKVHCEWLLFAKPRKVLSGRNGVRRLLERPLARMIPWEALLDGKWETWEPDCSPLSLHIAGTGGLIPSWEQSLGLTGNFFKEQKRFNTLRIVPQRKTADFSRLDRLSGDYELLPLCGTASGSLHRRITKESANESPLFLFLDPHPLQDGRLDRFVFATGAERTMNGESRHIVAELEAGWRPVENEVDRDVECTLFDSWKSVETAQLKLDPSVQTLQRWTPLRECLENIAADSVNCHNQASTILIIKIPLTASQRLGWTINEKRSIRLFDGPTVLQEFSYLLKRSCKVSGEWFRISDDVLSECLDCAPRPPKLEWRETIEKRKNLQKTKKAERAGTNDSVAKHENQSDPNKKEEKKAVSKPVFRAFENLEQAMAYEKKMRNLPPGISAFMHSHEDEAILQVQLNAVTIAHQLHAKVEVPPENEIHSSSAKWRASASWRIVNGIGAPEAPKWKVRKLLSNETDVEWLKSDAPDPNAADLQSPFTERSLWPVQRRTLNWMLHREQGCLPEWSEKEIEELEVPALDWRLEVKLEQPKKVFGGILADEVGAGKTTTCLALIEASSSGYRNSTSESEYGEQRAFLKSEATLILVPHHLMAQWKSEITKCFGRLPRDTILEVNSEPALHRLSIRAIQNAKIVLVSFSLLENDNYYDLIREVCAAENVPMNPGRAFQQWLSDALADLKELIKLSEGCTDVQRFWEQNEAMKKGLSAKYEAYRVVTQNGGADAASLATPGGNQGITTAEGKTAKKKKEPKKLDRHTIPPILHVFKFKRLIVDEFTYLKGKSLLSILQLKARSRWLLSGTPPLGDFDCVNTMARLIGTQITVEDEQDGLFSFVKKIEEKSKSIDKTYAEEFRGFVTVRSSTWIVARNNHAQKFLDIFVRQNPADLRKLIRHDHYHLPRLSAVERFHYFETQRILATRSIKFGFKISPKGFAETDEDHRLMAAIKTSSSPSEALITSDTFMRLQYTSKDIASKSKEEEDESEEEEHEHEAEAHEPEDDAANSDYPTVYFPFKQQLEDILEKIRKALRKIHTSQNAMNEKNPYLSRYRENLDKNILGDSQATKKVEQLVDRFQRDADEGNLNGMKDGDTDDDKSNKDDEGNDQDDGESEFQAEPTTAGWQKKMMRQVLKLNEYAHLLVNYNRDSRFHMAVEKVAKFGTTASCAHCHEHVGSELDEAYILGVCGHVVHQKCFHDEDRMKINPDRCPYYTNPDITKCSAVLLPHDLIQASTFSKGATAKESRAGSKMEAVLETIRQIPVDDRILIFVQFKPIADHLVKCLRNAEETGSITAHTDPVASTGSKKRKAKARESGIIDATKRSTAQVNKFIEEESTARICILKINSPDAAGWNLHIANHVFFINPYDAATRYEYDSSMIQAVGRARRFNQKKAVHVYHFLADRTIEVNIVESAMKGRMIAERDGNTSGSRTKKMKHTPSSEVKVQFVGKGEVRATDTLFSGPPIEIAMEMADDDWDEDANGGFRST